MVLGVLCASCLPRFSVGVNKDKLLLMRRYLQNMAETAWLGILQLVSAVSTLLIMSTAFPMVIEVRVYLVRTDVNCRSTEVSMRRYISLTCYGMHDTCRFFSA